MSPAQFILPPLAGAFIGWITNYLAVRMIFRPRNPIRILGFTFQGLIPRRQAELAERIAATIEENLISHKDVQSAVKQEDVSAEIEALVQNQIKLFLQENFGAHPLLGMLSPLVDSTKEVLVRRIRDVIPGFIDGLLLRMESRLSFREIIRRKIESFDLLQLEQIIYSISRRELKAIEMWGGILGFLVGLAQVIFVAAIE